MWSRQLDELSSWDEESQDEEGRHDSFSRASQGQHQDEDNCVPQMQSPQIRRQLQQHHNVDSIAPMRLSNPDLGHSTSIPQPEASQLSGFSFIAPMMSSRTATIHPQAGSNYFSAHSDRVDAVIESRPSRPSQQQGPADAHLLPDRSLWELQLLALQQEQHTQQQHQMTNSFIPLRDGSDIPVQQRALMQVQQEHIWSLHNEMMWRQNRLASDQVDQAHDIHMAFYPRGDHQRRFSDAEESQGSQHIQGDRHDQHLTWMLQQQQHGNYQADNHAFNQALQPASLLTMQLPSPTLPIAERQRPASVSLREQQRPERLTPRAHSSPRAGHTSADGYGNDDDGKPKRALTAYNIFFKHERARLLAETQADERSIKGRKPRRRKIAFEDLARLVSKNWKGLDDGARSQYNAMAKQDKERYLREKATYVRRKRQEIIDEESNESSNKFDEEAKDSPEDERKPPAR